MLPHTADVIVEAWGADDLACAGAAAQALIEICVSGEPDPEAGHWVAVIRAPQRDLVRAVLDEVVFALDTSEFAPVSAEVDRTANSDVTVRLGLAPPGSVQFTGAAPKAVVMLASSEPGAADSLIRCRFIVDV